MTQAELDREVSRATGETVATIHRMGFSLMNPGDTNSEPEPLAQPSIIDWDAGIPAPRRHHRPLRMAA
jgi:hypothetical protein